MEYNSLRVGALLCSLMYPKMVPSKYKVLVLLNI